MNAEVWTPLEVLQFEEDLQPTIKFVFQNCLICSTKNLAQKLCYESSIGIKCFTLEGDVYNPSGVLSGGYIEKKQTNI